MKDLDSSERQTYDLRWRESIDTPDADILCFSRPRNQVEFFYLNYNRRICAEISRRIDVKEKVRVLEVGCGRATASIYAAKVLGAEITMCDYSPEALKVARKNLIKHQVDGSLVIAEAHSLPFPDGWFDVVISLGVMEHIADPSLVYREKRRVLKPGGLVISMNVPEKDSIQNYFSWLNRLRQRGILKRSSSRSFKPWLDSRSSSKTAGVFRSYSSSEAFKLAAQAAGFQQVTSKPVNPFPTLSTKFPVEERLTTLLFRLILWIRNPKNSEHGFECSESLSRCHFLTGQK